MSDIVARWLLDHPHRTSFALLELMRPLPVSTRIAHAWWQMRNYRRVAA